MTLLNPRQLWVQEQVYKPCPFDFGLRKFELDFVVVILFKNAKEPPLRIFSAFLKKNTKTKSSHFLSPNGQGLCLALMSRDKDTLGQSNRQRPLKPLTTFQKLFFFGNEISNLKSSQ